MKTKTTREHGFPVPWEEDPTYENDCDKCGCSAYCYYDGVLLCIAHAVNEWFDELQTKVDPADQVFDIKYDVRADEVGTLEGFTATWFSGDFEGFISIEELKEIRKELKR